MKDKKYRIGVMVETLSGYGTKILDGFSRYIQQRPDWRIAFFDREQKELCELLATWKGDAILCTLVDEQSCNAAASRDIPLVNVSGRINRTDIPSVLSDDHAIGRMAAEHLLNQGFENFAFVRISDETIYSKTRGKGFTHRLAEAGKKPFILNLSINNVDEELREKITSLPRPLGIFASLDRIGARVIEACYETGLHVPEEIAVVGAGNHKQFCELCSPTLTSVDVDMERRGYEAGALMNHLLEGGEAPQEPIRIPPAFVEHRGSSDIIAFNDLEVVKALRFIRDNSNRTIKVGDVVTATGISRRSLEIRFKNLTGTSLHEEIWRVHLDRAKKLLASSDLSLQEIAEESGFRKDSALVNYFRLHLGMTPREFRVTNRR